MVADKKKESSAKKDTVTWSPSLHYTVSGVFSSVVANRR